MHRDVVLDNYKNLNFSIFSNSKNFPGIFIILSLILGHSTSMRTTGIPLKSWYCGFSNHASKSEKIPGGKFSSWKKLKNSNFCNYHEKHPCACPASGKVLWALQLRETSKSHLKIMKNQWFLSEINVFHWFPGQNLAHWNRSQPTCLPQGHGGAEGVASSWLWVWSGVKCVGKRRVEVSEEN